MSDWAKSNATRLMALETQRQETDARHWLDSVHK